MGHKHLAALVVVATTAFGGLGTGAALATEVPGNAGSIRYMKAAGPEFDRFNGDPAWAGWINERFWRMRTYTPYFDGKTGGYSRAWVYRDLYGIATGSTLARDHPEWILRSAAGSKLFIPWGCGGGTCPLYAGDFGDPGYRNWWIGEARRTLSRGYKGLWIDDVNLSFRVSDGGGQHMAPIDERAGIPMTETAWRRTMADFLEQIRSALTDYEIVHNAIWYAPDTEPNVKRALRAADYINLERGVNDGGLTLGGGTFGFETLLAFIDHRHAEGHGVVFDAYAETDAGREYGLASYFLTNNGADGYSNNEASAPDDWWAGFDATLGEARGARFKWSGLTRRDFSDGVVLVNQPNTPSVTVELGGTYLDVHGRPLTSVTLGPAAGAVLHTVGAPPPDTGGSQPAVAVLCGVVDNARHTGKRSARAQTVHQAVSEALLELTRGAQRNREPPTAPCGHAERLRPWRTSRADQPATQGRPPLGGHSPCHRRGQQPRKLPRCLRQSGSGPLPGRRQRRTA